jgi:hypothetical protein
MAQTAQININVNAQSANKTVDQLNQSISSAGGSAASLKAELRKTIQELQNLQPGTQRFQELSLRAGELRDQIADTNAVVGQLAGNVTERLTRGISGVVSIGVAGFQALAAGAALFGVESEDVNKSLVQMGALLNLSQAIETLGGLDQKLVEIRASFQSLTVATETQAVAETANAVATEGAAVATGALTTQTTLLGVAMKALPIIAIAAALGTLVYGVYQYLSASGEAEKQEKRRKKTLEDLKKQEQERVGTIAKESASYVLLINQLKVTNAGSIEREKLIKQINTTYNTTLKNLSDEAAFQKQLNLEVASYIAYQKAKFQLQKNEDLVQANLVKQEGITKKLTEAQKKLQAEEEKAKNFRQDDKSAGQVLTNIQDYTKEVNKLQGELDAANKRLEAYGKVNLNTSKVIEEIEGTTGKYNTTLKDNKGKTDDAADAQEKYNNILSKIKEILDENERIEEETTKKRIEYIDTYVDADEMARKKKEQNIRIIYEATKAQINAEITDNKKKEELLKANEVALTEFIKKQGEERIVDNQVETIKILQSYNERFTQLKQESKALQEEIRFGDGNTADTLIDLEQRKTQVVINQLEGRLAQSMFTNKLELDDFIQIQETKLGLQQQIFADEKQSSINASNAEYERLFIAEQERYDLKKDFNIRVEKDENGLLQLRLEIKDQELKAIQQQNDEFRQKELERLQKNIDLAKNAEEKSAAELALTKYNNQIILADEAYELAIQTEENINQTSVNLLEESNVKKLEAIDKYNGDVKQATIKTEDEINEERIKRFDDYLSYISNAVSDATNIISQFAAQQTQIATQQLNDQIALDRERIESQYAAALLTREQYDNEIAQLEQRQEQDQLALDRKNFRTEKALSIAGATIDGARAVLGAFAGTQGGIVVRSLAATLAGVFAASQIALIARQEFRAATGGIVPGSGSGDIDSVPARLAPGEAVINSQSTQAFLPLLSAINEVGGGRSFVPDLPAVNEGQRFAPVFTDNGRDQQPIRAYVVESDISTAQKRVTRIERSTRF